MAADLHDFTYVDDSWGVNQHGRAAKGRQHRGGAKNAKRRTRNGAPPQRWATRERELPQNAGARAR